MIHKTQAEGDAIDPMFAQFAVNVQERMTAALAMDADQGRSQLEQRIKSFEEAFQMSTEDMCSGVKRGEIRETWDICLWLQTRNLLHSAG